METTLLERKGEAIMPIDRVMFVEKKLTVTLPTTMHSFLESTAIMNAMGLKYMDIQKAIRTSSGFRV